MQLWDMSVVILISGWMLLELILSWAAVTQESSGLAVMLYLNSISSRHLSKPTASLLAFINYSSDWRDTHTLLFMPAHPTPCLPNVSALLGWEYLMVGRIKVGMLFVIYRNEGCAPVMLAYRTWVSMQISGFINLIRYPINHSSLPLREEDT